MTDDLDDLNAQSVEAAGALDQAGDATYQAVAASMAKITPAAAKPVLRALGGLLEALGGKIDPMPSTLADPAVVRGLQAIADASEDAAASDVIDDELVIDVGILTDDQGARIVGGQLAQLAANKPFLKWAKAPADPATKPAAKTEAKPAAKTKTEATEPDDDAMFMSRMGS